MSSIASAAGVGILAFDEQTATIDPSVSKVGTLTRFDVIALRAELDWLDELEFPWGPFPTYQRHLEYILSQYDTGAAQGYAHAAPTKGKGN